MELQTPGDNATNTQERMEAHEILQESTTRSLNARQLMLRHKLAHGSGVDLEYPDAEQIEENMKDLDQSYMVQVYGDGSFTTPQSGGRQWEGTASGYPPGTSQTKTSETEKSAVTMDQPLAKRGAPRDKS